ncbi:MAG TPA: DUF4352 domain-containing protein [Ruminiclostridium sp.]|nr:DUF4352 domain-containing protein [Ruminiclostridium sp.]
MKRGFILIFVTFIISTLCACVTVSNFIDNSSTPTFSSTSYAGPTGNNKSNVTRNKKESGNKSDEENEDWTRVEKSVTFKNVQYSINAYKKSNRSKLFKTDEGKTFLLIDVTVKNESDKKVSISSQLLFELIDRFGTKYDDVSFGALSRLEEENLQQLDGDVAETSELRGGLAYEIPKDTEGIVLVIKDPAGAGRSPVWLY